jgi:signal peptidase I
MDELTPAEPDDEDPEVEEISVLQNIFEWIEAGVTAIVFTVCIFTYVFRSVSVSGTSMLPTLEDKDHVILTNYIWSTPHRNDVVVITDTKAKNGEPLIKRIIALAGDKLRIDYNNGEVYLNGEKLDEPFIKDKTRNRGDFLNDNVEYTIPENCVAVLGDNRNGSTDSRFGSVGFVNLNQVLGRASLILWPLNRFVALFG